MRKRILLPALVLAGLAAGVIGRQYFEQRRVSFTAVDVENHYDAAGNPKATFFGTHSVWPDGSTEEIRHAVDGRLAGLRKIKDLARRVTTVLDTGTCSKTSYGLSTSEVDRARARPACSSAAPAGTLLGYSVVAEATATQYGDNRAVTTKKLAPAPDCFPLYDSTVLRDSAGKTVATVTRMVTAVLRPAPGRAELAMGRNYAERKPSEVMALHLKRGGQSGALLDRIYESNIVLPSAGHK